MKNDAPIMLNNAPMMLKIPAALGIEGFMVIPPIFILAEPSIMKVKPITIKPMPITGKFVVGTGKKGTVAISIYTPAYM